MIPQYYVLKRNQLFTNDSTYVTFLKNEIVYLHSVFQANDGFLIGWQNNIITLGLDEYSLLWYLRT